MMTIDLERATLKEIVLEDFRAAAVFEKYALDFCCRGGVTLEQACGEKQVDRTAVLADVRRALGNGGAPGIAWQRQSPSALIAHIVSVHHSYVRSIIPVLLTHTRKVAEVHGSRHPEVVEIARHFSAVAQEMQQHMMKEEMILFPYIVSLDETAGGKGTFAPPPFGTIRNPIHMMEAEHQSAGDAMAAIRSLSSSYTPPDDACTTYRITYQELQEFEQDLHAHVHLENHILFPAAIALEERLAGAVS